MSHVLIRGHDKDLGGFQVSRVLPHLQARAVGPFVFLDRMGPAAFAPGQGIDVRPHPHIGLSTLTFLFEGAILHRDSLGSLQEIRPGDVNWMVAGAGIVHSERSPAGERQGGARLHGLQAWVALPQALEECAPSFQHVPASRLPSIEAQGMCLQLLAGEAFGERSPVAVQSELHYLAGAFGANARLELPARLGERALFVVEGRVEVDATPVEAGGMLVLQPGSVATLRGLDAARIALLGGAPLDAPRLMWWNFVSSRHERIEQAKDDWRHGRFAPVPGESEFIPLP